MAATMEAGAKSVGDPNMHITVNAVFNYIFGALTLVILLLGGLILMIGAEIAGTLIQEFGNGAWWGGDRGTGEAVRAGGVIVGVMAFFMGLLFGLPQILAGRGLTARKEGGRVLALIVAGVHILWGLTLFGGNFLAILNLGYGGYAFWSLLRSDVVALFRPAATAA